ncbi:MAG TPA: sensor histidine kinase [Thermoleophilaceae bacterium]|nr:sensor histidine kinase [Thermoleophilaceae bacterium]
MTGLRRALWGLGIAGFIAGAVPLVLALSAPDHINDPALTAVFGPLVGWSFIGTGLFAWYRRPDNRFGALMAAVGFTWCVSGLAVDRDRYVFIVGAVFASLPFALLFHMLSAFPTGRLEDRFARSVAALGYFLTTVLWWVILLFYDTSRDDWASNPIQAFDDQSVADALLSIQSALAIVAILGVPIVLRRRWQRAGPTQRQVLAPVYAVAALLMSLLLVSLVADLTSIPDPVESVIDIAGLTSLVLIPFGFLAGLLRSRLSRAGAVSDLVARLSERDDRRRGLRDALADALGDPSLTLLYWLPGREAYVSAEGHPVELPGPSDERVATIVEDHGKPVAAIVHDASLRDERDLIAAVGAAATLTLENERLDAELRAKVEELHEQRRRSLDAALDERRRLERNLHDGAQQRLVSMALKLRMARSRVDGGDEVAADLLTSASDELDAALDELRELARGIHPAVLSDRGLDAALEALAHRSPVPVEVEATPGERLPESVELAAYFVVAEALTNVAKYASASHVTVRAVRDNGHVVVEVTDDGVGGADPTKGSGLNGLADRLCSVDGQLEVLDARGGGTVVRAEIPC